MRSPRLTEIKIAQKESAIFRELSSQLLALFYDEPRLKSLSLTRVKLSSDKSVCTIFFHTDQGQEAFNQMLGTLILYRPSLRKALAKNIPSRYTPELVFKLDKQFEKKERIEHLLDTLKEESK